MTKIEELREKANRLPLLPGVYIMLDASGEVIYVGKAKALKNRVTSYFRGDHLPKVAAMVSHVNDFNVIIAETEFEALVLENSLIKRHKPHYNILLKDDKGYPFLRLDRREPYPRFTLSNRANPDGAKYFGPYGGRGQTMSIIDTLAKRWACRPAAACSRATSARTGPACSTRWARAAAGAAASRAGKSTAARSARPWISLKGAARSSSGTSRPR